MASSTLLERKPVISPSAPPKVELPQETNLYRKAQELLDYCPHAYVEVKRQEKLKEIQKCFDEIGLNPYESETVERYKRAKQLAANSRAVACWVAIGLLIVAYTIGTIITWCLGSSTLGWCIGILASAAALGASLVVLATIGVRDWSTWEIYGVDTYKDPIPEYALQTAIDIKERLPRASFYIEVLGAFGVIGDPLLFFNVQGIPRRFYMEVWDEPKFQGERET